MKRKVKALFWPIYDSTDNEKINETNETKKTDGERDLHIVEKFITNERARFHSRPIFSLL